MIGYHGSLISLVKNFFKGMTANDYFRIFHIVRFIQFICEPTLNLTFDIDSDLASFPDSL
jgi:hypothetical protein